MEADQSLLNPGQGTSVEAFTDKVWRGLLSRDIGGEEYREDGVGCLW